MKQLLNSLVILLITFLLLEVIVRICGVTPFQTKPYQIESTPERCILPNPMYGFGLNPGTFEVTVNKKVKYTCTHNEDSLRICSYSKPVNVEKKIAIHGCSFTYGMSVDDSLTFPFLLQQAFPKYHFQNYAVPGYGNIQALIKLKQQIQNGDTPDMMLIGYAGFHEERNALNPHYRQSLYHGFLNSNIENRPLFNKSKIPYYDIEKGIQYEKWSGLYENWLGRSYLASVNTFQNAFEKMQMTMSDEVIVTQHILLEISNLCKDNKIDLVIVNIVKSPKVDYLKVFCGEHDIKLIDIGLELPSEAYSSLPYDIHPNAKAHRIFLERLKGLF